ncbi:MAG TPA: hypothetical protein VG225_11895 [Terracidiphilus sp.]|jgi:hypothetical protein|nr:hypothetical protein [Terracidiphilus sp.]
MRVLIVVNKWWECDPALAAMLNDNARPAGSPWPQDLRPPRPRPELTSVPNLHPIPRAIFPYKNFAAEVWCISDILDGLSSARQSSSQEKFNRLCGIFPDAPCFEKPSLVIAVGTASVPFDGVNHNGCVVAGTGTFMHNGFPDGSNPDSNLNLPSFDKLVTSTIPDAMFNALCAVDTAAAVQHFLPVPLNPATPASLLIDRESVALGTINVTKTSDYAAKDCLTVAAYRALGSSAPPAVSLETTHGLIREKAGACPFVFVSAIVNRFQQFGTDVAPRMYAQQTAAATNAGVALSWMLASLDAHS